MIGPKIGHSVSMCWVELLEVLCNQFMCKSLCVVECINILMSLFYVMCSLTNPSVLLCSHQSIEPFSHVTKEEKVHT